MVRDPINATTYLLAMTFVPLFVTLGSKVPAHSRTQQHSQVGMPAL